MTKPPYKDKIDEEENPVLGVAESFNADGTVNIQTGEREPLKMSMEGFTANGKNYFIIPVGYKVLYLPTGLNLVTEMDN